MYLSKREFLIGTLLASSGSAMGQPGRKVLGLLGTASPKSFSGLLSAFYHGMNQGGIKEGKNLTIIHRWGENNPLRLPSLARELVELGVTAIAATGGPVSLAAAQKATSTIPIVFTGVTEPVKNGFVRSLSRPGGNTTGVAGLTGELDAKRLALIRELVPSAETVGVVVNPYRPDAAARYSAIQKAAASISQQVVVFSGGNEAELERALKKGRDAKLKAILFSADPYFNSRRYFIIDLVKKYRIPAMFAIREMVEAGGLVSYGTSMIEIYRDAGRYTARVLNGELPENLPIVMPTKFELVVNKRTSNDLGLVVPESILVQAHEIIE